MKSAPPRARWRIFPGYRIEAPCSDSCTQCTPSFRGVRSTSPESILPAGVMDSGPAPGGASRNDEVEKRWHHARPQKKKKVICLSTPPFKNIPVPFRPKSPAYVLPSRPTEGRLAIVTNAGRDAVDVGCAPDERAACGRRSRVVLTPRRWRQVGDDASHHAGDGGKQARSPGRARRKPLKPLRGECRAIRRDRGD
jgi:hypothetical protein